MSSQPAHGAARAAQRRDGTPLCDALPEMGFPQLKELAREFLLDKVPTAAVTNITFARQTPHYGRFRGLAAAKAKASGDGDFPVIFAFHGTNECNLKSILIDGLDPSLRSGQAHGPGEYFSTDLGTALHYSKGACAVLVFAICTSGIGYSGNSIVVVADADYQLPIAAVRLDGSKVGAFGYRTPTAPPVVQLQGSNAVLSVSGGKFTEDDLKKLREKIPAIVDAHAQEASVRVVALEFNDGVLPGSHLFDAFSWQLKSLPRPNVCIAYHDTKEDAMADVLVYGLESREGETVYGADLSMREHFPASLASSTAYRRVFAKGTGAGSQATLLVFGLLMDPSSFSCGEKSFSQRRSNTMLPLARLTIGKLPTFGQHRSFDTGLRKLGTRPAPSIFAKTPKTSKLLAKAPNPPPALLRRSAKANAAPQAKGQARDVGSADAEAGDIPHASLLRRYRLWRARSSPGQQHSSPTLSSSPGGPSASPGAPPFPRPPAAAGLAAQLGTTPHRTAAPGPAPPFAPAPRSARRVSGAPGGAVEIPAAPDGAQDRADAQGDAQNRPGRQHPGGAGLSAFATDFYSAAPRRNGGAGEGGALAAGPGEQLSDFAKAFYASPPIEDDEDAADAADALGDSAPPMLSEFAVDFYGTVDTDFADPSPPSAP